MIFVERYKGMGGQRRGETVIVVEIKLCKFDPKNCGGEHGEQRTALKDLG